MSAGAFLKSEFYPPRTSRYSSASSEHISMSRLDDQGTRISSPKTPERRLSKSKNFFLKIGTRKDKEPKPIRRIDSTTSKKSLTRLLSHSIKKNSGSHSEYYESTISTDSSSSQNHINSSDIASVVIDSRIASYDRQSLCSESPASVGDWLTSAREEFLLCPEITITPEVLSLDGGSANLWVAVQVSGTLRLANQAEESPVQLQNRRRTISGNSSAHLKNFGRLHSMRINLITTRDSSVLEVIGNLHELKTIHAGETCLIIAKLRIAKVTKATSCVRESSTADEIIADLENHLGGAITSYLTVRLTYKHSGFLDYKRTTGDWEGGTSNHTTKLQTEASAFIKRNNLQSAWSPRNSREVNGPLEANPLIKLIETHLPADQARYAIRRLANDRTPIPTARRLLNGTESASGSEETVALNIGSGTVARIDSVASVSILQPQVIKATLEDSETQCLVTQLVGKPREFTPEIDPARKIWTEMRRNSRGYHHHRTSVSNGLYSNDSEDCVPSHLSSTDIVDGERKKIKDMALKNKRSVGADTLKSFAPSVGKAKVSTIGGLGLGVGRSWWVGNNWW